MYTLVDHLFYTNIKNLMFETRNKVGISINSAMVIAYWNIGRLITEKQNGQDRADYGDYLIRELSKLMTADFGKGFSRRNLESMRKFYSVFPDLDMVSTKLSWSHYLELISLTNDERREFYLEESIKSGWSARQLSRQISSAYYDRLFLSSDNSRAPRNSEIEKDNYMNSGDFIKNPYILEFLGLKDDYSYYEKDLEKALISNIQKFLLELGRGFSFVERQKRITSENNHYIVDLVFYNFIIKCFVLIDLKTDKLSFNDLGQIDFYVRYFDKEIKRADDNPTIGIVLCPSADKMMLKYSLTAENKNLFISKYMTYMPTENELKMIIEEERKAKKEIDKKND